MSHALFMAFNKHYRPLQNGTQEFRSIYRATSVNWKNLTSVMYVRVPNKPKSFFRIPSYTCLPVHYCDVTSRYGTEEVTGWTTAECLINSWLRQRISARQLSVEILELPSLLLNGCREQSGRGVQLTILSHLYLRTLSLKVLLGTRGRVSIIFMVTNTKALKYF